MWDELTTRLEGQIVELEPLQAVTRTVRRRQAPGAPARGGARLCAHVATSCASLEVSPRSGAVWTSSVGAGRARAQAWQASLNASSIQASGREFPRAPRSLPASSGRCLIGARPASARSAGTADPSGGRAGAAGIRRPSPPSRWPTRGRSPRPAPRRWLAAARERKWGMPSIVCREPSGAASGVALFPDPLPPDPDLRARAPREAWTGEAEQRDDPVDVDHQQGLLA